MSSLRKSAGWSVLVAVLVLSAGCSSGENVQTAAPTFCPTRYSAELPVPLAENAPPRAYYQQVSTTRDTPLDIVLYACDPDDPTTSEGLTWRADLGICEGPCNGNLSAYYGTYPDGVITYTPRAGFTGTDSILYVVSDSEVEGNIATIEITVQPPQQTATSLYFGGFDDNGLVNLWSYNSGSGLMTVPDNASILATEHTYYFFEKVIFNGDLFLMGDRGDGGAVLYQYNRSDGLTAWDARSSNSSNFAILDNTLYMGFTYIGTMNGYLWATDGVSPVYTVPGTSNLYIENITAFNGSLFFDGDFSGYKQLWARSGSGTLTTLSSLVMGLDPMDFTPFGGDLFFTGRTDTGQRTLWRLNGSGPISTVGNLNTAWMWDDSALAVFDSLLCISANAGTTAGQLWSYHPVNGFNSITNNATYDVSPSFMTPFAGQLVFGGYDDSGQPHLMYTDGSSVGVVPGTAGMEPAYLASYDSKLFFGSGTWPDNQLWYITSTLSSPVQVSFINTGNGPGGLSPSALIEY